MRTEIGGPSSSMRLSAWTATATSVARRSSVCARYSPPLSEPIEVRPGTRQIMPRTGPTFYLPRYVLKKRAMSVNASFVSGAFMSDPYCA